MNIESATIMQDALRMAHWSVTDLWVAAVGIGGDFQHRDIEQIIAGTHSLSGKEHDILASAFNDHFVERNTDHPIQYWQDLPHLT
jgi:hypothetical protein